MATDGAMPGVGEGRFPIAIARRENLHGMVVDQWLCLSIGRHKSWRLYTAEGWRLAETDREVASIEFDMVDENGVNEFLIESFWLLAIDVSSLRGILEDAVRDIQSRRGK